MSTAPHAPNLIAEFHARWPTPERRDRLALADERQSLRFGELHTAVGRLAGGLRAAGVQRGDRVALALTRGCGLAVAILATMACGACPCPLEPRLGADELQRRHRVARLRWTLLDEAHANDPGLAAQASTGRLRIEHLPDAEPLWQTDLAADEAAFLLFTSGSSGKPKGVLQHHGGLLVNATGVVAHSALGASDHLLHVMPIHHTNGVNNQLLAPLLAGASVFIAERFRAEDMPGLLDRVRPSILTGVPTMYARMLDHPFSADSLARLRLLRCGSAPITEDLHRRIEAHFGQALVVSYGLSEATCTSTMNPPGARRIGTVGTVLAGQSVFLRGPGGERITAPEQDGEICVAGPSLMCGYLDEDSAGEPVPAPDGLLRTGDLGRFDPDGYLRITGRLKDVIIRGGENLSPQLIEEALAGNPGVGACCVVGRPDADLGEVPVAFVVRRPGVHPAVTPEQLSQAVRERLSRIHQPADYRFIEALPENATGKVDRKALARQVAAGADTALQPPR